MCSFVVAEIRYFLQLSRDNFQKSTKISPEEGQVRMSRIPLKIQFYHNFIGSYCLDRYS